MKGDTINDYIWITGLHQNVYSYPTDKEARPTINTLVIFIPNADIHKDGNGGASSSKVHCVKQTLPNTANKVGLP